MMNKYQHHISKWLWHPSILLGLMVIFYTLLIGNWAVNRFQSFNATLWDLGIMIQTIWNTAHGRILHESVNLGFSSSRLAVAHWELIYLPLAVIYHIFPSVPLLLYIQTFILACGVFPIYKFAIKKLSSKTTALLICLAYLFFPALHGSNLFDLHGLTFATTFLLFTFYYVDQGNQTNTLIFAFISICCREDLAFIIFMLGLYSWVIKKQWKVGLILTTLSIIWLTIYFSRGYFIDYPETLKPSNVATICNNFFGGEISLPMKNNLSQPLSFFQLLYNSENIKYIAKLILPVLGFCFFAPIVLFISLPILLLNMFSNYPQMHQIEYHYTATITPFIFLAAIKGLANVKCWLNRFHKLSIKQNQILFIAVLLILVTSVISTTQFSIVRFHRNWHVSKDNKRLSKRLREIPSELSVSTTARLGAHLANRIELYNFPENSSAADMILLELNRAEVEIKNISGKKRTLKIPALNDFTRTALEDTNLGLNFVQNNVFCLAQNTNPRVSFKNYAFLNEIPDDVIRRKIDLGSGLIFLGWKTVYIGKKQAHFQLYWQTSKKQTSRARFNFYLTHEDSTEQIPHSPMFGRIKLEDWIVGKTICDHLFINLPKTLNESEFAVQLSFSSDVVHPKVQLFNFSIATKLDMKK